MTPQELVPIEQLGIALDRRADVPLGVQLVWALRSRVRDGQLRAGQRLPGVRDLADALGVNMNTVRSVYQRLEHEGVVETRHGSGTFIAATASNVPLAVGVIAADAARQAQETGVDVREIAAALYMTTEPQTQQDETTHRRQQLRTQIAALEQTVIDLQAKHPGLLTTKAEPTAGNGPRLLDITELEHTQTRLLRHLAALQAAIDQANPDKPASEPQSAAVRAPKRSPKTHTKSRPATAGA